MTTIMRLISVLAVVGTTAVLLGVAPIAAAEPAVVIASHPVADFNEWKKRFDAGKANREKVGMTDRFVMRDADKPNVVIVVLEAASPEAAKKFVSDPAFKERIKAASSTGTADIKVGVTGGAGAR